MTQHLLRRISRLEKRAKPRLESVNRTKLKWQTILQGIVAHAAVLTFLVRYGNPNIGEPLSCACRRVSETGAWRECREKYPLLKRWHDHWGERHEDKNRYYSFDPHSRDLALIIGTCLRHAVIATFPGANEKEKLSGVFASAPPWLIWFTFADYTAGLLGLTLPDLSSVSGFARSMAHFDLWYGEPSDAFEPRPWANGPENEPLARTDLDLVRPATPWSEGRMRLREQQRAHETQLKSPAVKRTDDWPNLPPAKQLEMPLVPLSASRSGRHPMW